MPRRSYGAFVTTTDRPIGRVLAKLDELGLTEDTVVVFTSDDGYSAEDYAISVENRPSGLPKGFRDGANGGGGSAGRLLGAKDGFLEGGIGVPAVVSYPAGLP